MRSAGPLRVRSEVSRTNGGWPRGDPPCPGKLYARTLASGGWVGLETGPNAADKRPDARRNERRSRDSHVTAGDGETGGRAEEATWIEPK